MTPKQTRKERRQEYGFLHLVQISNLPYTALFVIWLGISGVFAVLYFLLILYAPEHGPSVPLDLSLPLKFLDALYYSIITATSTGYGDIVPHGASKILASIQSIMALFIFAVFVTKLVSQRQEIALQEVHRLSYESIVHNTRGDLFIIRKDLEAIMHYAKKHGDLTDDLWETLKVAYQQAQTLISEIPDFYNGGNALYQIDIKREELLLEGVRRTLHRINRTLDVLSESGVDWPSHTESVEELLELITIMDSTAPIWEERSPYDKKEAFEEITEMKREVHTRFEHIIQ